MFFIFIESSEYISVVYATQSVDYAIFDFRREHEKEGNVRKRQGGNMRKRKSGRGNVIF